MQDLRANIVKAREVFIQGLLNCVQLIEKGLVLAVKLSFGLRELLLDLLLVAVPLPLEHLLLLHKDIVLVLENLVSCDARISCEELLLELIKFIVCAISHRCYLLPCLCLAFLNPQTQIID